MTPHINAISGFMSAIASAFFGGKVFLLIGEAATGDVMPTWMKYMLGPLGALVGLIVAVLWLEKRLNKSEAKNDKKEAERDEDRKKLIEVLVKTEATLTTSNQIHNEVKSVISRCQTNK